MGAISHEGRQVYAASWRLFAASRHSRTRARAIAVPRAAHAAERPQQENQAQRGAHGRSGTRLRSRAALIRLIYLDAAARCRRISRIASNMETRRAIIAHKRARAHGCAASRISLSRAAQSSWLRRSPRGGLAGCCRRAAVSRRCDIFVTAGVIIAHLSASIRRRRE